MSPANPKAPDSDPTFDRVIENSTTRVPTRALLGRGVDKIRVLSQSRFLDIVRSMVEESIRRRALSEPVPAAVKAPVAEPEPAAANREPDVAVNNPTDASTVEMREEAQTSWETLRTKHQSHLDTVEDRLSRLTGAFDAIQGTLERLEGRAKPAQTARRPVPRDLRRQLETSTVAPQAASGVPTTPSNGA